MNCTIRVVKTKALISVTAKLICDFVFAYADCWFSHAAAQLVRDYLGDLPECISQVWIQYGTIIAVGVVR